MQRLLIVLLVIAAVPCGADVNPCRPPSSSHLFVLYTGTASGCTLLGGTDCMAGEIIAFEAKSFGGPVCPGEVVRWDFGDGSPVATGRGVMHAYARGGAYEVQVTVSNPQGTATVETTVNIPSEVEPLPAIVHEPLVIDGQRVPRGVRFTTYTSPGPWSWDFGDGTSVRTGTVPQDHVYAQSGVYVVTLLHERSGERFTVQVEIAQPRTRAVRH